MMKILLLKVMKNPVMYFQSIKIHRLKNPKDIEIDNMNVNSLKNKFEAAEELVQNKVDICFFSETKTDETFQNQ